ncbi:extracellular electron transfer flavoprotein PplA [Bacillus tuaregi]|uniref:extracellular electron transfer flavoprotein PplA n=1 Tax=Bacillus tuaregi TaxID=1816695 RepID=UPI0008F811FE|nr:extracellular electron transfer flavoprotein PplA [Bacillus tuaregi]
MTFGKKFAMTSMAVSLALFLGACGNSTDETKEEKEEITTEAAEQTENETTEQTTEQTETAKKLLAGGEMKDGTYTLVEKDYAHGYKVNFEMTVKGGKITESNYNYVNEEGKLKTDDAEYQKNMSDKTGVGPIEFVPALNDQLLEKQNAGDIEVVTGATHSSDDFMNYAQQLIQAAQKGDTTTIEIDKAAELKDGEYSLTEKNLSTSGWKTVFKMVVKDGQIVDPGYNNVNGEGKIKTEDEEYQKAMSEKTGVGPQDFIPALNNALIEKQNAGDIEVVTGATHSWHGFKIYANQLINAAQKGDTTPIEVDNFVFEK